MLQHVAKLSTGSVLAQIILLLSAPVLTRLYSPDIYGEATVYISIFALCTPILGLRIEAPIVTTKSEMRSQILGSMYVINTFFVSTVAASIIHFVNFSTNLSINIFYVWSGCLAYAFMNLQLYNAIRSDAFGKIATSNIIIQLIYASVPIGLGIYYTAQFEYIVMGYIFSNICAFLFFYFNNNSRLIWIPVNRYWVFYKRYHEFIGYGTIGSLFSAATWSVPTLVIATIFGLQYAALYTISMKILQLPTVLFGKYIAQVLFRSLSVADTHEKSLLIEKIFIETFLLCILPISIFIIWSETIFTVFLGDSWSSASEIALILIPWAFCQFIVSCISPIFAVYEKQKNEMKLQVFHLIIRIAPLIILSHVLTFHHSLAISVALASIYLTFVIIKILSFANIDYTKLLKELAVRGWSKILLSASIILIFFLLNVPIYRELLLFLCALMIIQNIWMDVKRALGVIQQ